MSRFNLETTGHFIHTIDCLTEVAEVLRLVSMEELVSDERSMSAIEEFINEHIGSYSGAEVQFNARLALVHTVDHEFPDSESSVVSGMGHGTFEGVVIMPELIADTDTDTDTVVAGTLPDLFLQILARDITASPAESQATRLWVPPQYLDEVDFLVVSQDSLN